METTEQVQTTEVKEEVTNTPQQPTLMDLVNKLKHGVLLFKKFIDNPTVATKEIQNANLNISTHFGEIETGLKGEFTNAKAVDLGKQYILKYLKDCVDDIKKNDFNLQEFSNKIATDIINHLDVIYRNVDMTIINRRKVRYEANKLTMQYMDLKLKTVVGNFAREYDTPKQVIDFLYTIREIMAKVRLNNDDEIDKYYKRFQAFEAILSSYVNNIYSLKIEELPKCEVDLKAIDSKYVLVNYIEEIQVEQELSDADSLAMFGNIVDGLDRTYEDIKRNVEVFREKVLRLNSNPELLPNYVDNLYSNVLDPFSKQSITTEEYKSLSAKYLGAIESIVSMYAEIQNIVLNYEQELNANIDIYSIIYNLVDEATLKGQVEPTKK